MKSWFGVIFWNCLSWMIISSYAKSLDLPISSKALVGEACFLSNDCVEFAWCVDGKCDCKETYFVTDGNKCSRKLKLDEECEIDEQCVVDHSTCRERETNGTKYCTCDDEYFDAPSETFCLKKGPVGDFCRENKQCQSNNCENSRCQCEEDSTKVNGECIKNSTNVVVNDECEVSEQCSLENSICKTNENGYKQCTCKEEYVAANGKCLKKAELNEKCDNTVQCVTAHSVCSHHNICVCDVKYIAMEENNKCILKVELGEKCSENSYCIIQNANCTNGICQCNENNVRDKNKCFQKSELGENCEVDKQCPKNSICRKNINGTKTCECDNKSILSNDNMECSLKRALREKCEKNEDCNIKNSICESETCECNAHSIEVKNKCYLRKSYNEACEVSDQCSNNSVCDEKKMCHCKNGFSFENGQCQVSSKSSPLFNLIIDKFIFNNNYNNKSINIINSSNTQILGSKISH